MKFDFDKPVDRSKENSCKWNCKENELPMWVADMDFEVAPCIQKVIRERISHPCFGYSELPDSWALSYVHFWKKAFDVDLKKDCLTFSLGIIPSLSTAIRAFSNPGDEVLLLTPVYNAFNHSVENSFRKVLSCPLRNEGEHYSIDFNSLEMLLSREKAKILVLCNPHNPVGRVWRQEELLELAKRCFRHGVLVISDEVHALIGSKENPYTPFSFCGEEARLNSISLLAPTKAFNIAGIQTSACYAENPEILSKLKFALNADEVAEGNFLSYPVAISSLEEGEEWLNQMNEYVHANYLYCLDYFKANLPKARVAPLEATYLLWADLSAYEEDDVAFCRRLRELTGLWITPGSTYGQEGKGHVRINLATQRKRVEDGMKRLSKGCLSR